MMRIKLWEISTANDTLHYGHASLKLQYVLHMYSVLPIMIMRRSNLHQLFTPIGYNSPLKRGKCRTYVCALMIV